MTDPDVIDRLATKGDGVAGDGRHIPLSAPGDRVTANGGLDWGIHHVEAPCIHFPICGGCQLQHVDDASYAAFVSDRVVGALAGQGVRAGEVLPPHISPARTRRRAALRAVKQGKRVSIGFTEGGSHNLVDLSMCEIMDQRLFALIAPLRHLLTAFIPDKRAAHVKLTLTDQGVDMLLEGVQVEGLAADEKLGRFAAEHGLARLTIDAGDGPQTRWEPQSVTVSFGGVSVPFPPYAFLQATPDGEAALTAAVTGALPAQGALADLFCGLGTFALALGANRPIYAAEASRDIILALKGAAHRAQRRLVADHRDLFRRPLVPEELNRFAAVLIDPPRAGAREQVVQIAQSQVSTVAYISCNPGSFARDAAHLVAGGYTLESVRPVGQFRWSTHVELAAIFRRD